MDTDKLYLNGVDIQNQFGLYLNWRVLSAPSPQLDYQVIPGRHGSVDLSEPFGSVYYNDRTLNMNMTHLDKNWYSNYEWFLSTYHGKRCRIVFSNDPDWYWYGRVVVNDYSAKKRRLTASAIVFPFKLAVEETEIATEITASTEENAQAIVLPNARMPVTPKVTVAGSTNGVHLKWGNMSVTVDNGEQYVTGLTLDEGTLNMLAWGDGTITFTYRQGAL